MMKMFKKYSIIYFLSFLFLSPVIVGCSSTTPLPDNTYVAAQNQTAAAKFAYLKPPPGNSLDIKLMKAVEADDISAVKKFLSMGANPNVCYNPGVLETNSTLGRAKTVEMAKVLIEGGADPNVGCPLLWAGNSNNKHEMIAYLVSEGANIYQECPYTGRTILVRGNWNINVTPETVRTAIKLGYNPSEGNLRNGNTPLHSYAAKVFNFTKDDADSMHILIDAGANVNARNKLNDTPLSLAKRVQNTAAIKILTAANAKE
jgi:ankyrin repeat protein